MIDSHGHNEHQKHHRRPLTFRQTQSSLVHIRPLILCLACTLVLTGCQTNSTPTEERPKSSTVTTSSTNDQQMRIEEIPPDKPDPQPPKPGKESFWVVGHYVWEGNQWTWKPGFWYEGRPAPRPERIVEPVPKPPRPTSTYVPGYWEWKVNGWDWVPGRYID